MNGTLLTLAMLLLALILLDLSALRFGVSSRHPDDDRPDWW
jgi:hypothetical protein